MMTSHDAPVSDRTRNGHRPPKPSKMEVRVDGIPVEMRASPRWLLWKWDWKQTRQKWDKPPRTMTGALGDCSDPDKWCAFDDAVRAYRNGARFDGIGFALGDGYAGVDLDRCRDPETGVIAPWAQAIISKLGTYVEVSPSGTGIKLFCRGSLASGRRVIEFPDGSRLEMFDTGRYFTVTGRRLESSPEVLADCTDALRWIQQTYFQNDKHDGTSGFTDREIALEALGQLGGMATSYHDWLHVGMALYSVDSSSEMLAEWDRWSQAASDKYDPAACSAKWGTFGGDGGKRLSIGSLIYWAKLAGWKPPRRRRSQAARGTATAPNAERPNEAVDDPYRLAREFLAEEFTNATGETTLIFHRDEYLDYDSTVYRHVPRSDIRAALTKFIKRQFDAENLSLRANPELLRENERIPICRKVTTVLVNNAMGALQAMTLVPSRVHPPAWLDGDEQADPRDLLATRSGLLHMPRALRDADCLIPPTARLFTTNGVNYEFDPLADCPNWRKFLESVWPDDPESIETLQDWMGYLLTGGTSHHKLLMLLGPPRSGKGTIGRVIKGVIGENNLACPTLGSLATQFGLWPLLNKSAALVSDARLSGRTDAVAVVERLLSISGEDPQDVHRKNLPTLEAIRLPVRFMVMTNELPNMRDASGALTSRIVLLRMTHSFLGSEDKRLGDRLAGELPGILNWAIRGWHRLRERGAFIQPESGRELLADLDDLASPISHFVRECCHVGPEYSVRVDAAFSLWKGWCEGHGCDNVGTRETFGRDIRAKFPQITVKQARHNDNRVRVYQGIGARLEDPGTR